MKEIIYIKGNAIYPVTQGNKIIAHICNDIGAWGAGFVMAISNRWLEPEKNYRRWHELKLGKIQVVNVEKDIWVANMIAQHNIRTIKDTPPIRYDALEICLYELAIKAKELDASVHMPRIGCGLAGGT